MNQSPFKHAISIPVTRRSSKYKYEEEEEQEQQDHSLSLQEVDTADVDGSELMEYNGQITFYETFNRMGRLHLTRENYTFYFDTASKSEPGWEYWRCCCKYCRARIVVSCQPYRLENDSRPFRLGYFKNEEHNHKPGQYPDHVRELRNAAKAATILTETTSAEEAENSSYVDAQWSTVKWPPSVDLQSDMNNVRRKRPVAGGGRPNLEELSEAVDAVINEYPDFPKKGILFKDIMPLFGRPQLLSAVCNAIADKYRYKVDAVAGLEARGFMFGPTIAMELQLPFIPIRKKGKLPGPTISETYMKEYGEDAFEIQTDADVNQFREILLLDDLLATGGSMVAGARLIQKAGGMVKHVFVLVELVELGGRALVEE